MWLDNNEKGIIIVSASVEPCGFRIVSRQYKMNITFYIWFHTAYLTYLKFNLIYEKG
jgi:hypothetical protein